MSKRLKIYAGTAAFVVAALCILAELRLWQGMALGAVAGWLASELEWRMR